MAAAAAPVSIPPMPTVVLISGNGSNLQALIDACQRGELDLELRAVIANRDDAYGLQRARQAGIAAHAIRPHDDEDRARYDARLQACIDEYQPKLVLLAGFMRILSDDFVAHFHGRLLNIHPSLLPKYPGLNTHARALADGETEHGASIHFVTEELDGGPVIARYRVPVHADDTADSLRQRVHLVEHKLYPLVAQWFATGRLKLGRDGVELDEQPLRQAIDVQIPAP